MVIRAKRSRLEIKEVPRVRINTVIVGEPAEWLAGVEGERSSHELHRCDTSGTENYAREDH